MTSGPEAIAIVGMECLLPGAENLEGYWHLLSHGIDAVKPLPDTLLDRTLFFSEKKGELGKTYSDLGGLVPAPKVQPKSGSESEGIFDQCHLLFAEVAAAACRRAGYSGERLKQERVGVYVGHSAGSSRGGDLAVATLVPQAAELLREVESFQELPPDSQDEIIAQFVARVRESLPRRNQQGAPFVEAHWAAGLLTEHLGLEQGSACVVDAACASSLVALLLGVAGLRSGELEVAIVGGASCSKLESLLLFSQAQSCSATGSRPFDDSADGLISSEGYAALVLKTESKALQDGDSILALVRGLGMSTDGRGRSLWAPRVEGQCLALQRAYGDLLDPGKIDYIEGHATSTQLGDATEIESLNRFFGPHLNGRKIPLGSVKSNIGHTLETAGLASLVKVVLAMQHGLIPASINVEKLNQGVDWDRSSVSVAREPLEWPQGAGPKRAGVSAFGIGGLNVHVVLEQASETEPSSPSGPEPGTEEPLAVVGRGLVLAGARGIDQFAGRIASAAPFLSDRCPRRWPNDAGLQGRETTPWSTPTRRAGYIQDFNYSGIRHRIPPNQMLHANPLQFLLLEATDQALDELSSELPHQETAVLIGSRFGGDFSDRLEMGLKFPRLESTLGEVLEEHRLDGTRCLSEFRERFYQTYDAMMDETGSFTSSTLASRLSKTYDLNGGGLALDVGDCSSEFALVTAARLLNQGFCRAVVCGAAHQHLDLCGFIGLGLGGRTDEPPGEGAAVVILKTLSQARADGDRVYAVIDRPDTFFKETEAHQAESGKEEALTRTFGHLQSAQGLVSLIGATAEEGSRTTLERRASFGMTTRLEVRGPQPRLKVSRAHFGAPSWSELEEKIAFRRPIEGEFGPNDRYRAVVLSPNPRKMEPRLELAQARLQDPRLQDQDIFVAGPVAPGRIAFVFTGQGSQYSGMLANLTQHSEAAGRLLVRANAALSDHQMDSFETLSESPAADQDPVTTQVLILIADLLLHAALSERGLTADCVCGHSFGEIPALVVSDVLSLEEAVGLTIVRARALLEASPDGGLLSIRAGADRVKELLDDSNLYLTHFNSREQTVVGGRQPELKRFSERLGQFGIASRLLRVPGALHTPLVEPAVAVLKEHLETLRFRPPTRLFYSNADNRAAICPEQIRANLLRQLVAPMHFESLLKRLYSDGVRAFVEVGPGQVLTRLGREALPSTEAIMVPTDHAKRSTPEQLERVEAALCCLGLLPRASSTPARAAGSALRAPLEEFDATERRRRRWSQSRPAASDTGGHDAIEKFLLDYVVDLTGYPREVVQMDWDLEADLGIDSIKRVQLFGELKDLFGMEASEKELIQFRTLDEIARFVREHGAVPATVPGPGKTAAAPASFEKGLEYGRRQAQAIREDLRRATLLPTLPRRRARAESALTAEEFRELEGLARGAGVHPGAVVAFRLNWGRQPGWRPGSVTHRYVMRMVESAPGPSAGSGPCRGAVILGSNPVADSLVAEFKRRSLPWLLLDTGEAAEKLLERLEEAWAEQPLPHLFVTTPHDVSAPTRLDLSHWQRRRGPGLTTPFWLCQRWLKKVKEAGLTSEASLVGFTRLGGGFGFESPVEACESGALTGLFKSIIIENWVGGERSLPVKLLDSHPGQSPEQLTERALQELACPSYDVEIGWNGSRTVARAHRRDLPPQSELPRGGTWVCTGGGRGITAFVAARLAQRFEWKLHLIGRAPAPDLPEEWSCLWPEQRRELRLKVMERARQLDLNPIRYWEDTEKAFEIRDTLTDLKQRGLQVTYHSCDVADHQALERTLEQIRAAGPIEGILHGAGASRDAKFEDKTPERVEECLKAKIDGTLALMTLTREDPLKFFVAFGSISGRFGANGHADYSLGNDMMAKLVDWYRQQRPEVGAVTFHWHAWGDIGMATKGETQLGLKMIDMQFMPAQEGLDHLVRELQAGAPEAEVLITDERYYRQFHHSELAPSGAGGALLDEHLTAQLDPTREPFLKEHRVGGKPILPLAVALELLCEGGWNGGREPLRFRRVEMLDSLRFYDDAPKTVRVHVQDSTCELRYDFTARNGVVVDPNRCLLRATLGPDPEQAPSMTAPPEGPWTRVAYPEGDSSLYHGPRLRALTSFCLADEALWGWVTAPPLVDLAGSFRDSQGWRVPSAAFDACLYAVGIYLALRHGDPHTLPLRAESFWFGRLPVPGESCLVQVQQTGEETYAFTLWGADGEALLGATGYQVASLRILADSHA